MLKKQLKHLVAYMNSDLSRSEFSDALVLNQHLTLDQNYNDRTIGFTIEGWDNRIKICYSNHESQDNTNNNNGTDNPWDEIANMSIEQPLEEMNNNPWGEIANMTAEDILNNNLWDEIANMSLLPTS